LSWPKAALGKLGEVNTGSTPKTSDPNFWDGNIPFVTPSELGLSVPITSAKRFLSDRGAKVSRIAPVEAVLVCCIGSLGKTGMAGCAVVPNQQINWVEFDNSLIWPRYGYYACNRLGPQLEASSASTTLLIVNKSKFSELTIPVPPLKEQRRIAAILDKADELRRKRKRASELLGSISQAVFLEMFGDALRDARLTKALSAVTTEIYRYPTYFGIQYEEDGVPEIRGELIRDDGTIVDDRSKLRFISQATSKRFSKTILASGDLVMSVRGTVGKIGRVPKTLEGANMTANLIRIAPDRKVIEPDFLWFAMRSPVASQALTGMSSSTTIATVKASDLRNIPIVCPPLHDQRRFTSIVSKCTALVGPAVNCSIKAESLFSSLQSRAFSGQL
jgi:type I restriction enzyme S subunit